MAHPTRPPAENKGRFTRGRKRNRTHGEWGCREYRIWANMLTRCRNPRAPQFKNYGARGVTVCERWESYENFVADVGRAPSPKHTPDRIDNGKGYCPENCRRATRPQRAANRSATNLIPPGTSGTLFAAG